MKNLLALFLAIVLAALPAPADAQARQRPVHIAFVALSTPPYVGAFKQALRELGHAEGKDLVVDEYWAGGDHQRLAGLAAEAVRKNPAVIVAVATPAIRAVQERTTTIPVVMSPATDPVGSGFVKSLARPGGNITGVGNLVIDLSAKALALVRDLLPKATRIAVLHTRNPTHPGQLKEIQDAAAARGITISPFAATSPSEVVAAFAALRQARPHALIVLGDPFLMSQRGPIAELAATHRLPAVYQLKEHVEAGGLASYGPKLEELFKRAAFYVDRILKGGKPAELAVELPTHFELFVNRKTAQALGLALPKELLLRADQVIE